MAKGVPEASKSDFWSPKGEGSLEDGVGSLEDGVGSLEAAVRVSGSRGTFWSHFGSILGSFPDSKSVLEKRRPKK